MADKIIDVHVHFGAPAGADSPCYWSDKFTDSVAYLAMLIITGSLFRKVDIHRVKRKMLEVIKKSRFVDQCVLLAMDEVYDESGNVKKKQTHLFTPNAYIADLARENEEVLFGASVHPYRNDWEDELDFCLEKGAVLCKWIPSSMQIDPSHEKCVRFYEKLARSRLPLLCHGGPEHAIPTSNREYEKFNNPKYLKKALDMQVKVIVPHCAMPFWELIDDETAFIELKRMLAQADSKGWNLYADLSALCIPMREPYIDRMKTEFPLKRLVFGSDYPIPVSEFTYYGKTNFLKKLNLFFKTLFTRNLLDKNYLLIRGMELGEDAFTNAEKILKLS